MSSSKESLADALKAVEGQLALPKDVLERIMKRFLDRMDHGLANLGQDMAMIPTFGQCWVLSELMSCH